MAGERLGKAEARSLCNAPLDALSERANALRRHFCGEGFSLCSICNAKSGRCSEDCKFCAQSSFYETPCVTHPLLSEDDILEACLSHRDQGILRFSLVTSGRSLPQADLDKICAILPRLSAESSLTLCGSFGLLSEAQCRQLKEAGLDRIHNNLESSPRFFSSVCTTHSTADKIQTIRNAQSAGLSVCSGGLLGLGETWEDRIDLALALQDLDIRSVPLNLLNPISGTPYANRTLLCNEDLCRTVALFRFLLPKAVIRLAGGRNLLPDQGERAFCSGANGAISGDFLTTAGNRSSQDKCLVEKLGFSLLDS